MSEVEVPKSFVKWPVVAAIAINLVPIAGVLFWGWSAFALIFLYWSENVMIGVRTLASMFALMANGAFNALGALFFGGFFAFHYGLFCFVHGTFVVALFGGDSSGGDSMLDLAGAARGLFAREPDLWAGFVAIALWQAVMFVLFIVRGEWRNTNPLALMGAPYPRIIILHLAILVGGFLLVMLNQPIVGLVVLALIKTGFDVAEALGKAPRLGQPMPPGTRKPGDARRGHPGSLSGPSTRR